MHPTIFCTEAGVPLKMAGEPLFIGAQKHKARQMKNAVVAPLLL